MSIKTKAGQVWTDSVAYVALLTGAGLSIAGNVANVLRTRGDRVDNLDVVLAVAFPALVVLMVEVFVSARWKGLGWPMQALRWLGTVSIGAVAMRVSWVHLHELMISRGQQGDVATLGPLAIDFLAIMATALILAGRGRTVPVAAPAPMLPGAVYKGEMDYPLAVDILAEDKAGAIADEASDYLARLSADLDSTTTPAHPLQVENVRPVSPAGPRAAVKLESIPAEARLLWVAWLSSEDRPSLTDACEVMAGAFDCSSRTARRWKDAVAAA